ncbi:MAG: 6-phosphofructokinase [Propionibacteriaceae bacterium]|jgi:6-phosphofructokinase 1|nr:6-phosphofructokinase [Propionibacteriaceae bacterium]
MEPLLIPVQTVRTSGVGRSLAVMTSGGDAPGMNAALRAVVRTALSAGAQAFAIHEGYQGLIDGTDDDITPLTWESVSGILNRGGTAIGTFRSEAFRHRPGRLQAVANLVRRGINRLVVIGGDGSLKGLEELAQEWPGLLDELLDQGQIDSNQRQACDQLIYAGLVGSIDNDLWGTDQTIGADSALHRIQDAIDAITSTAASHQRTFVVEVMGRHCGYLALMSAISGGCDYVLIPERPPAAGWQQAMCEQLRRGREAGRKDSIVIVAEGATDQAGQPITAVAVRQAIEQGLDEDTRVTILGHVQRGGTPSAYDRWASTWLGYCAAAHVLTATGAEAAPVFGFQGYQVVKLPLSETITKTRQIPHLIEAGDYAAAIQLRGDEFAAALDFFDELSSPLAHVRELAPPPVLDNASVKVGPSRRRIGVLHSGGLAPGMNTAAKAVVRLGIARDFDMIGLEDGFPGLIDGRVRPLSWRDVDGWDQEGGATLGTRRYAPQIEDLYAIGRVVEETALDGLIIIGGWTAYQGAHLMLTESGRYPSLRLPVVCVPATIDNNLPATQMSIGADTALNVIVDVIDKIKMSATASARAFVAETMGRDCGYLALTGALAGGAEQVYLNETGLTLDQLRDDLAWANAAFAAGERDFFLFVRNENANANYTTDVLYHLLSEAGQGRYDARTMVIGHIQQGGSPTPADRILATELVEQALRTVADEWAQGRAGYYCVGVGSDRIQATELSQAWQQVDLNHQRPAQQWWLGLTELIATVGRTDH